MSWRDSFHHFSRLAAFPPHLRQFFYGIFFYRFGAGLISLAGPIFLFTIGQELSWLQSLPLNAISRGIFFVLLFYLLERVLILLTARPMAHIIPRLGFHWSMIVGLLFFTVRLGLYDYFLMYPALLFVSLFFSALGIQLFWLSYHTYFTTEAETAKIGSEVGGIEFLTRLAEVLAPLLGALIAGQFGFATALWSGILFFAVAALFLLMLPRLYSQLSWHWSDFAAWCRNRDWQRTGLGLASFAWEQMGIIVFWPIFLFVTFQEIESVGYILATASLLSLLFVYLSGWIFDHRRKQSSNIQKISGVLLSVLWIPRLLFATSPVTLVLNDAIDRLTTSVYNTLFYASILFRARGKHVFIFFVNREIAISLLWILLILAAMIMLFIEWNWTILFLSFLAAGLVSLLFSKDTMKK